MLIQSLVHLLTRQLTDLANILPSLNYIPNLLTIGQTILSPH